MITDVYCGYQQQTNKGLKQMTIAAEHFNPNVVNNGGVCAHSDDSSKADFIVFCVGNDYIVENAFKAWATHNNIGYKCLIGSYKGLKENAFIVNAKHINDVRQWFEDEESILLLGPLIKGKRKATLVYMDGITSKVELGDFNYTSKDYALKQDAWTFDPSTNSYYVAG